MHKKVKELTEMKETLITALKSELAKGIDCIDTKEAGEVVDMIKDLAKAEKECFEACYYKAVCEAMDAAEWEDEGRMGYNNRRYANGRYASTGHGHISGYRPMVDQDPYLDIYMRDSMGRDRNAMTDMVDGSSKHRNRYGYSGTEDRDRMMGDHRYGQAYNDYQNARKHYTKTNSQEDKDEMNAHACEHMGDTISTIREIWKHSDPDLRKKMKNDLHNLISEME